MFEGDVEYVFLSCDESSHNKKVEEALEKNGFSCVDDCIEGVSFRAGIFEAFSVYGY